MALPGITFDQTLIDQTQVDSLGRDHIDRHLPVPKTFMVKPVPEGEPWLTVDETYPGQIAERFNILCARKDWHIERLDGADVRAAEEELRDKVADYMVSVYPESFTRAGDRVSCKLTGAVVDLGQADPLAATAVLASEDMALMLPCPDEGGAYRLKSGALLFPDNWSLRSRFNKAAPDPADTAAYAAWQEEKADSLISARLGKTAAEIHFGRVPHYDAVFAEKVERAFRGLPADKFSWRRNWNPVMTGELSLHADLTAGAHRPPPTPDAWHQSGYLRSEHQTFVKLPRSEAIIFGVKTYLWKLSDFVQNEKALEALITANDNLPQKMVLSHTRINSFRQMLETYRKKPGPSP
jgi:hypothetical protein